MGNTRENRFTVHQRLAASEARLTALEQENAALRAWVSGTVASQINDAKNIIQSAQAADFRDLQVGIGKAFSDLKASVKNGVDGKDGAPGPQGPRGDVLIPNADELSAAVKALRLKLAKWQAAIQKQFEHNYGRKHRGLEAAINNVLKTIENDAR